MRNRKTQGFTLIELLIVIAIIGILAAVLIPNLLNARSRAFDTAAQTCLKELGVQMEVIASNSPFEYTADSYALAFGGATVGGATITPKGGTAAPVNSCANVVVTYGAATTKTSYFLTAKHLNGTTQYMIKNGTGVTPYVAP